MTNSKEPLHLKDLSKHSSEFRQKAADLGQDVQDLGQLSKDIAADAVGVLGESAVGYYQQGLKEAGKWEKKLEQQIKSNPLPAVLIAAGVGLILGAVWKSR
jgi:hypothetical protein